MAAPWMPLPMLAGQAGVAGERFVKTLCFPQRHLCEDCGTARCQSQLSFALLKVFFIRIAPGPVPMGIDICKAR